MLHSLINNMLELRGDELISELFACDRTALLISPFRYPVEDTLSQQIAYKAEEGRREVIRECEGEIQRIDVRLEQITSVTDGINLCDDSVVSVEELNHMLDLGKEQSDLRRDKATLLASRNELLDLSIDYNKGLGGHNLLASSSNDEDYRTSLSA